MNRLEFLEKLKNSQEGLEYLEMVEQAKDSRDLVRENGFEIHHICPRSICADNSDDNKVKFTVFEHCKAHLLLAKAVPCYKTMLPLTLLSGKQVKSLSDLEKLTLDKLYGFSQLRYEALHSKKPESQRLKIAEANRKKREDPEWHLKLKKPKSEETIQKMKKPKQELHRKHLAEVNVRKGEEYQKQKKLWMQTGKVEPGSYLESMLNRGLKAKKLRDLKRKVACTEEFLEWLKGGDVFSYKTGRKLNSPALVSRFLKSINKTVEDYLLEHQ